jgi:hypothetical protein
MNEKFSLQSFLIMAAAVIVGLFLFNMFSQDKIYDSRGNEVGTSRKTGKVPSGKKSAGRTQRTATGTAR